MARTREKAAELPSLPGKLGMSNIFSPSDVSVLAQVAKLPLRPGLDTRSAASKMTKSLFDAHAEAVAARNTPSPGQMRDALASVSSKSRDLLLALGIEYEPKIVSRFSRTEVIKFSPILSNLIKFRSKAPIALLPSDLICSPDDEKKVIADRYAADAVRALAFLTMYAEAATPSGASSGPRETIAAFKSSFFVSMAYVYCDTFNCWPSASSNVDGAVNKPAVDWLQQVIKIALDRASSKATFNLTEREILCRVLSSISKNKSVTMGKDFGHAIATARRAASQPTMT